MKIYRCKKCGNIIIDSKFNPWIRKCCSRNLERLVAKDTDELHIPIINLDHIEVGTKMHQMNQDHHIDFILVEYTDGYLFKPFKLDENPIVRLNSSIINSIKNIYAYCNLDGLFVNRIEQNNL